MNLGNSDSSQIRSDFPFEEIQQTCERLGFSFAELGIMVVDHGSRRAASNEALLRVVTLFQELTPYRLVEPAHMELAEPTIEQAFDRLVNSGAKYVIVHPYFLLPGRHWAQDIPNLAKAAAARHPGIGHLVTAPLGIHRLMSSIMSERIQHCLKHVAGEAEACELCDQIGKCKEANNHEN